MAWDDEEDTTTYQVVVNHEDQYSIWPDYKAIPRLIFEKAHALPGAIDPVGHRSVAMLL